MVTPPTEQEKINARFFHGTRTKWIYVSIRNFCAMPDWKQFREHKRPMHSPSASWSKPNYLDAPRSARNTIHLFRFLMPSLLVKGDHQFRWQVNRGPINISAFFVIHLGHRLVGFIGYWIIYYILEQSALYGRTTRTNSISIIQLS